MDADGDAKDVAGIAKAPADKQVDFRKVFGRGPDNPWFEEYMTEDADVILVGMGTISLSLKVGIRELRKQGKKVGVLRLRWFRPFATDRLVAAYLA